MRPEDPIVVLTGATKGIGRATALRLAPQVGTLIVHGPQAPGEVATVLAHLRAALRPGAQLHYLRADYRELAQVRGLAEEVRERVPRVDVLINNAAQAGPERRTTTVDGNEVTLQTNFLAGALLTRELIDQLQDRARGRIVNVASDTHYSATLQLDDLDLAEHPYTPVRAYAQSKLAIVTYTCWLADELRETSCEALSIHPGVITSDLLHALFGMGGDPPDHGAANLLSVAFAPERLNGLYFDESLRAEPNPTAHDTEVQARLVELTDQLLLRAAGRS
jgi:NAD(P)-dependent dehydrogenase (short-subunit alcohol dehydrogenase family)